ncbi:MAG: CBS domain-containing protein [Burkholderiaceae bacterium]|nr:CBS domain-containing protein [Burkholderiaceae bacterium]
MLVRNWMQAQPVTIAGDVLVSEAKRLMSEHRLHALPVVEGGRLRGLVTRANLLRMGQFVLRTQNPDEFDYFVTRLRVRDIMVRNPASVQARDTMAHCLRKGQELGVAQFPVLDGDQLVGVISANEIFQLAAHCVGATENDHVVMLAPLRLAPGVLARVCAAAEGAGAALHGLYPVGSSNAAPADAAAAAADQPAPARVILRFGAADPQPVLDALAAAGFEALDAVAEPPRQRVA